MRRRLFNVVAVLFLGLAVVLAASWVLSVGKTYGLTIEKEDWVYLPQGVEIRRQNFVAGFGEGRFGYFSLPDPRSFVEPARRSLPPPMGRINQVDRTYDVRQLSRASSWPLRQSIAIWPLLLVSLFVGGGAVVLARRSPAASSIFRQRRRAAAAWLFPIGAIVSTTAFGLAFVFCLRSYPYFDRLDLRLIPGPAGVQVNSSRGSLMFAWTEAGPKRTLAGGKLAYTRSTIPPTRGPLYQAADLQGDYIRVLGFVLGTDGSTPLPRNVIIFPYWFVLITTALASGWLIRASLRSRGEERDAARGLCVGCGYDLRGSRERCPECGLDVAMPVATA